MSHVRYAHIDMHIHVDIYVYAHVSLSPMTTAVSLTQT